MSIQASREVTNSQELRILLEKLYPKFDSQVVAIDELSHIEPKMKQIIIVNYEDKYHSGTHWVSIQIQESKYAVYFDSYGLPPPESILTFLRKGRSQGLYKDIVMNIKEIQPKTGEGSKACGWFILKFLEQYIGKRKPVYLAINSITVKNTLSYAKQLKKRYYYFLIEARKQHQTHTTS